MPTLEIIAIAFALFWVLAYIRIFIHELGHVIAAILVGFRPTLIVVGTRGKKLRFTVGGLSVHFGMWPFEGITRAVPRKFKFFRLKYMVYVLSGPIATALSAFFMLAAYRFCKSRDWPVFISSIFGLSLIIESFLLLGNLLPHNIKHSGVPSDGKQIWTYARMKRGELLAAFNAQRRKNHSSAARSPIGRKQ